MALGRWSAIGLAVSLCAASAHAGPAPTNPTPAEHDASARAKAAVAAGRKAAKAGEFAIAIEHFQQALALRPAASLHFNIAVCHHNLMLAAAHGTDAYDAHRRAAIESYASYLEASPAAEDHAQVTATIEELGGRPPGADEPWVIERIDPGEVPTAPSLREHGEPELASGGAEPGGPGPGPSPRADTPTTNVSPGPLLPVGRLGPFVPLTLANLGELSQSATLRALPGIGLGVRGGGLVGPRRRVGVGGELWATGQPISSRPRPVLVAGAFAATAEYAHPLAKGRLELGAGGGLGLML